MTEIQLISWNVNGIRASERKGFSKWLNSQHPHIMCIQETKAQEEQIPDKITETEYHTYFSSAEKKGYSGTAVLSIAEPENIETTFGIERFDREGRIIKAEYEQFTLYNVYFPNGKASDERLKYKMDFYSFFLDMMEKHIESDDSIIVCGDVNTAHREIDLARPKENEKNSGFLPEERAWIDNLLNAGFTDTFRYLNNEPDNYSWWDYKTKARERNVGWRIDYFFISNNMLKKLKKAEIMKDITGSDHCPVSITLEL